jgi:hypothetical protein
MWNTLTVRLSISDGFGSPVYGTGGYSHEQAHAEMQAIIDRLAETYPDLMGAASRTWRRGAEDDLVHMSTGDGIMCFALYEYPDGEDPVHAALAWLDDFSISTTGRPARMIVPPPGG